MHSHTSRFPGKKKSQLYNPDEFVKLIVDGVPVDEVARSAFKKVREKLVELGKEDVAANVLGRDRDLRMWIVL